jgi:hypothetical protein
LIDNLGGALSRDVRLYAHTIHISTCSNRTGLGSGPPPARPALPPPNHQPGHDQSLRGINPVMTIYKENNPKRVKPGTEATNDEQQHDQAACSPGSCACSAQRAPYARPPPPSGPAQPELVQYPGARHCHHMSDAHERLDIGLHAVSTSYSNLEAPASQGVDRSSTKVNPAARRDTHTPVRLSRYLAFLPSLSP